MTTILIIFAGIFATWFVFFIWVCLQFKKMGWSHYDNHQTKGMK